MHLLMLLVACPGGPDSPYKDTGHTDSRSADDTGTPADDTGTLPLSCADVEAALVAETTAIRSCTDGDECGQVLTGTSCGCTRDWVARNDADTARFYELVAEAVALGCELDFTSTCDCPETDGYACVDQVCTWDYDVAPEVWLEVCEAADGAEYSTDGFWIDGNELVVVLMYGGGCADHEFTLCWPDQSFMESAPVQVDLEIMHVTPGDPCDAWITEEPRFDLTPLADAWHAAYGSGSGEVLINLLGDQLSYTF